MSRLASVSTAKVTCPLPPAGFQCTPRVREVLSAFPRVWVEAPAGFGKTTQVAQWARETQQGQGFPVAWLSLDPGDGDPLTLYHDLTAALIRACPGITLPLPPRLHLSPGGWYTLGHHLAAVTERLGSLVVVLDDVHRLADGADALRLLEALVEGAGPDLRLVLTSREGDAHLPIVRWQASGRLGHLGVQELRLSLAEVRQILGARLGRVSSEVVVQVAERTGGWPLAVRLVAEHLANRPRGAWALEELVARGHELHRYLAGEVLNGYTDLEQRFFLVLSLPEEAEPAVAEALLPGHGEALYARLAHPPWFTSFAGGGPVSRLHPLLRAFLRSEANLRLGQRAVQRLHRRLATVYAQRQEWPQAVEHALAAQDWAMTADLLAEDFGQELMAGNAARVRAWVGAFPLPWREEAPALLLVRAHLAAMEEGHAVACRLALRAWEGYAARNRVDGMVACLALCVLDLEVPTTEEVLAWARRVRAHPSAAVAAWGQLWLLKLGLAAQPIPTPQAIEEAVEAVERAQPGHPQAARARILGDHLRYLIGQVGAIHCSAPQMVTGLTWRMFDYWPALVYAGRWDELSVLLDEARRTPVPSWAQGFVRAWLEVPRAVLSALHGDATHALEQVEAVEELLLPEPVPVPSWPLELSVLRAVKVGCLVRVGQLEAAERLARANQAALATSPAMAPVGHLDLAQVLLARGRWAEAEAELVQARQLEGEEGLRGLYWRTLHLALRLAQGQDAKPLAALLPALNEVRQKGAYGLWPTYDPGPIHAALLQVDEHELPRELASTVAHIRQLFARARLGGVPGGGDPVPAVGLATLGRLGWAGSSGGRPLPSRRVVELLVRLLWAGEPGLSREALAEAIWPEAGFAEQANRLRVTLHGLRGWLKDLREAGGAPVQLTADRHSVRLIAADSLGWDVALMRQEMARARTSQAAGAADALVDHARAAFALYQGPFLPDPAWYEPFLYERQELERQHDAFAEWLGEVLGPLDPRLPGLLGEAIRGNPGEVALHRLRIQSLMAQGRVADARRALDACAAALQALVGVPPPPELVRLVEHAPDAPSGG